MKSVRQIFAFAFFTFATQVASADLLLRKTAKPGAWATFYCTEAFDDGGKRSFYVTLKLLGKKSINGKPHRWVELKYHRKEKETAGKPSAYRFLTPEKELSAKGDPLRNHVEAWERRGDKQPVRHGNFREVFPRLFLVTCPGIENLKDTGKSAAVPIQKGKLKTRIFRGTAIHKFNVEICRNKYELQLSEKVPFGTAAAKITLKSNNGYTGTIEYSLQAMGTNAKSDFKD